MAACFYILGLKMLKYNLKIEIFGTYIMFRKIIIFIEFAMEQPADRENCNRLGNQARSDAIADLATVTIKELRNPFLLHRLFDTANSPIMIAWLQKNALIRSTFWCTTCDRECILGNRSRRREGLTFRCYTNNNCEITVRKNSFFEQFRLSIADVFIFLINYLDGVSLYRSAQRSGNSATNTITRWGSIVRHIMMNRVHKEYFGKTFKFQYKTQLDECCLSRRVKYHRGEARGPVVWVWGCCCIETGRILILPVLNRSADNLVPIIEKYIEKGTKILTDGWAAYASLNSLGYQHYAVNHSSQFQIQYYSSENKQIEVVDTNAIEGFWSHMRCFLRRRNGKKILKK